MPGKFVKIKSLLVIVTLMLLSTVCLAGTVFLADGRQVSGKVTQTDTTVTVVTKDGKIHKFDKSQVLYVAGNSKDPVPETKPSNPDTTKPDTTPTTPDSGNTPVGPHTPVTDVTMGKIKTPEAAIFKLMRNRKDANQPGSGGPALERLIEKYRGMAHDRQRKSGERWLKPAEFARLKKLFKEHFDAARKDLNKGKVNENATIRQKEEKRQHRIRGFRKLREAVKYWPDHEMRMFLFAAVALEAREFTKAENLFRDCIKRTPQMPTYKQGLAYTLMARKRHANALTVLMELLEQNPDSPEAVAMLSEAISQTPGKMLRTETAQKAKKMLEEHSQKKTSRRSSSSSSKTKNKSWIFPGKKVSASELSIPIPPADRYEFRQALAVPISKNTLVLDSDALIGASQVRLKIAPNTYVNANFKKSSRSRRKKGPALTTLTITGYEFTPVEIDTSAKIGPSDFLTAHAINWLAELGTKMRSFSVQVKSFSLDGTVGLNQGLAPGEPAGPVFGKTGKFLGFLAGKINSMEDSNPDILYSVKDMESLLKKKYRSKKSDIDPKQVEGKVFEVHILIGENLTKKRR